MARNDDLLSTIRSEIEQRLAALRPLLVEHDQLLAAVQALDAGDPPARTPARRPSARRASRAAAPSGGARVSARKTSATAPRPSARKRGGRAGGVTARSKTGRAPRGAAREAILGALEHGSHTVGELVMVTAMSAPNINGNVRRLLAEGAISKTERGGKTAYALASGG